MSKSNSEIKNSTKAKGERLPCRGCTRSCRNYDRCDGRPWRASFATDVNELYLTVKI